jgi:hypothetical protein
VGHGSTPPLCTRSRLPKPTWHGHQPLEPRTDRAADRLCLLSNTLLSTHTQALNCCNRVLELEPANSKSCAKALYRRARAHIGMDALALARDDLTSALQISPSDKAVRAKLKDIRYLPVHSFYYYKLA